ncbi:hypothetical protein [Alkaliphilus metalliredigens]|uniref:hypothetical protein n=1 Tax=Alkaliphilus metalliredigens TaxID=208226 RepID=UPI0012EEB9C8|nr:hypothetical protein [Alkaliphilus metalliredigens]
MILLVFQSKNLYRFLESERKDQALSKNTYYRFLSLLAIRVTEGLQKLTKPKRVKILVLDDTITERRLSEGVNS